VFLSNFRERMTAEILQKADESGYALAGIIKVASMIEKEAANDNERAIIASVIYNRINAGMPIQIDSTILYLYQDHEGAPTQDMLNSDSPYNTRLKTGLPPTAICNPGMASIRAALNPSDTDYYFYALDTETGTHRFFTTASEFNAFVATQQY
ncbi:MAG: endolytic transglycosylase MltG, partial [Lachnospiraceae bacterium]|nr:endolytic transglycosylase MltG [Lachnospiraceae bacterium]